MRAPWLPDVLRAAGLTVIEVAGWRGRGRELGGIDGVVAHHTATGPRSSDQSVANLLRVGRTDLAGPLAQLGLDRSGRYWLIADGRCNHNGYGEWGNSSIGIEAFNDGVGEAWPARQVDAYQRGAAAILTQIGLPPSRVKGHKETDPGRKIDPAGIDMNTFRARVADLMAGDDEMTPEQEARLGKWMQEQANRTISEVTKKVNGAEWKTRRILADLIDASDGIDRDKLSDETVAYLAEIE